MSVACGSIRVWVPTNITATNIVFSTTDCDQACDVTVTVTWTNTGGRSGSFVPNISIDGTPATPTPTPVTLDGGASVTEEFTVTGLTVSSGTHTDHSICPIPN